MSMQSTNPNLNEKNEPTTDAREYACIILGQFLTSSWYFDFQVDIFQINIDI